MTSSPDISIDKIGVVIPAAGGGSRFGGEKQFQLLGDKEVLFHSVDEFILSGQVNDLVIVVNKDQIDKVNKRVTDLYPNEKIKVVSGGARRQDSVYEGIKALNNNIDLICIHDAARPFITNELISTAILACDGWDGVVVAMPITDTVKVVNTNSLEIKGTRDRNELWGAQTPQIFRKSFLLRALELAKQNKADATDESVLMENAGYKIKIVQGLAYNFKITRPEDWVLAEAIYRENNG